ncbi:N-acetyl sugar amidotransferase [Alcaligenes endophyticus]|uniref:N-acetyl sugar amidotransferase n=1 Tax=Alcaligenes endophyticus TaxID=1929088 RepID=A0ABT8EFV8_9BURK|nr:N-acetyl sugar amidotransferase [Alcaligenes endophyticus]MCX5590192.1 N-acetyl sugar amidotransferase [Alcaligenes endophyticus]MDN4120145.1 N-acetyl sugar amidotransferase [Alcaligenes endophyticus]
MTTKYQQCTWCIMDNSSDETITFNLNGQCNYCENALLEKETVYFPNEEGEKKLNALVQRLKKENKDHQYDCVMGISGGLDSSYLAYLGTVKWGLRVLAVHVDDGFDTEISKNNIARLAELPNFDLRIIKPDPQQFHELTKAYMRAGVPNLAVPQDNVLFACVYQFMKENKLNTFLSGGNFALECILQRGNTHDAYDLKNLKFIHNKFGKGPIDKLTMLSALKKDIDAYILNIQSLRPLNYIDYNRDRAMKELADSCGFEYYGSKHLENDLTKFIQQYWFYHKFGVDKRTSHLSSMIVSGQMSREEAQRQYALPLYDEDDMQSTISHVISKLGMSKEEFDNIMADKPHQHSDYPTSFYLKVKPMLAKAVRLIKR